MLGTEYNWLISVSHPTDGHPRARLAGTGFLTLAVGVFCFLCVSLRAEPAHRALLREATVAAKAGDIALVIAKLEAARAARPDYPRVLNNLARYYMQAGRTDDALAQLRELAAMGLQVNLADEAFAALRTSADFAALTAAFKYGEQAEVERKFKSYTKVYTDRVKKEKNTSSLGPQLEPCKTLTNSSK